MFFAALVWVAYTTYVVERLIIGYGAADIFDRIILLYLIILYFSALYIKATDYYPLFSSIFWV